MNNKTYSWQIDIYRILLIVGVCLMHFEGQYFDSDHRIFEGMYLAVDFFFILSGYLLYRTYQSKKYENAWSFTKPKIIRFFPYSFIMLICFWTAKIAQDILAGIGTHDLLLNIVHTVLGGTYELLFLHMFLPAYAFNGPTWYISVLLVVGYVYYYLLCKMRGGGIEIPILVIGCYMFMHYSYGSLDITSGTTSIFKITPGIIRGAADMGVGILISQHQGKIKRIYIKRVILLIISIVCIFCFPHSYFDYILIFFLAMLVRMEFSNEYQMSGKAALLFMHFRDLSLGMYFVHQFIVNYWGDLHKKISVVFDDNVMCKEMMLYLFIVVICAEMLLLIVRFFDKHIKTRRDSICNLN